MNKTLIWIGAGLGSAIGGYIPSWWHDSLFSIWGIVLSTVGGVLGIIVAYKLNQRYF